MRLAAALSLAGLVSPLVGQAPRLVDSVESPVAYLCLEAMPANDAAVRAPGPVQRLLADPSLDALFRGASAGSPTPGSEPASANSSDSSSGRALALVRGVLARSSGELELALTGVLPSAGQSAGQPLLILRARLQRAEAERLQQALDGNELAEPARQLGTRTTYKLRDGAGAAARDEGRGRDVELALVGTDLIVGNDGTAMREVLAPAPAPTVTAGGPRSAVLSAQPHFQAMRQRLTAGPGSLWLYGDWPRLRGRLESSMTGVPGWVLGSSGLGSARAIMVSIAGAQADFAATLLLDFDDAPEPRGRRPRPPGMRPGIDGWFAAAEPVAARTLIPELPANGLGGLVLSVDLASVARRSRDSAHVMRQLEDGFARYGLDFERNVLGRLGTRGTLQLHVGRGADAAAEVTSIWSLRTKNKKAAGDLFADLRRVAEAEGIGRTVPMKDGPARDSKEPRERRPVDLLEIQHGDALMFVAAHDDVLLLCPDAETLGTAVDDARRNGRPRTRRSEAATAMLQSIGGDVAGLFDLDLEPLFDQVAAAFAAAGARLDLSALPKRHVGHLDLQRRDSGTVVRVSVLSSR